MAGKGDRPRPGVYSQEFRDNFDKIFGDRRVKKPGLAKEKKVMPHWMMMARLMMIIRLSYDVV